MKWPHQAAVFQFISCIFLGCLAGSPASAQEIFAGISPLKYAAEKLSGKEVGLLLKPGENPHSYQPTARQIARLSQARVLFSTGVPFEVQLASRLSSSAPNLRVVATDKNLPKRRFSASEMAAHNHDHDHGDSSHAKGEVEDPHVWLSPRLYAKQCKTMAQTLMELYPEEKELIQNRLAQLEAEINEVHGELKKTLRQFRGGHIMVYHPAFGYFCDAYGLKQVAIEIAGKEPTPGQLVNIIRMAKEKQVHVIFVQKQFPVSTARAVADAIDGTVVSLDPLAEDILEGYRDLAGKLAGSLAE